jgi:hypothetical protein
LIVGILIVRFVRRAIPARAAKSSSLAKLHVYV